MAAPAAAMLPPEPETPGAPPAELPALVVPVPAVPGLPPLVLGLPAVPGLLPALPTTGEPAAALPLPAAPVTGAPEAPVKGPAPAEETGPLPEAPLEPPGAGSSLPQPARPAKTVKPTRVSEVGRIRTGSPNVKKLRETEATAPEVERHYNSDSADIRRVHARSQRRTPNKPTPPVNMKRAWKRCDKRSLARDRPSLVAAGIWLLEPAPVPDQVRSVCDQWRWTLRRRAPSVGCELPDTASSSATACARRSRLPLPLLGRSPR